MIIIIVLILLTALCFYLAWRGYEDLNSEWWALFGLIGVVSLIFLVGFGVCLVSKTYQYEVFAAKRQAFTETIDRARQNNQVVELAAISKDFAEWNMELAEAKYYRTTIFKDFVDKRVDTLEPIK